MSYNQLSQLNHIDIADFPLQAEDTEQINGYAVGLQQEFPRARIERYDIYCIGNQGFQVFPVTAALPT